MIALGFFRSRFQLLMQYVAVQEFYLTRSAVESGFDFVEMNEVVKI